MKSYLLLLALIVFGNAGCHPDRTHVLLEIQNKSQKTIYFDYSPTYPDTSILKGQALKPNSTRIPSVALVPGDQAYISNPLSLEEFISQSPGKRLMVFIFDADVIKTTNWDTILKNNLILKRYDLTLDTLNAINRVLQYQ